MLSQALRTWASGSDYNSRMRLAWFSPMPPVATGIARCSADLVRALAGDHAIDVFVDQSDVEAIDARPAHEFAWRHRQQPYDLVVYQLGNSSHHDYQWPYLFRYPGLVVLHDTHLHHARAACLLRTFRRDDYRAEFRANHPEASADAAELAAAGFDNHLHYAWPTTRLIVERSRLVAVHSRVQADRLRETYPAARIASVRLGHGTPLGDDEAAALSRAARDRYGIPQDAIVFGCAGGLTPDKRVPQILAAFAATRAHVAGAHLLLAGATPAHFDPRDEIARLGLDACTTITGYLPTDEELTACIAAADVTLNLRWPTAREISGPWLRGLAAGKPSITIDLWHTADVPSIDPRTWRPHAAGRGTDAAAPYTVAIDILDEDHSLRLAMRRLGTDEALRRALGRAARAWWTAHHSIAVMAGDYRALLAEAAARPAGDPPLPAHLVDDASATLRAVADELGVPLPVRVRP
jgi:glycosyltransferase involved in cell wall biosynthesis